MLLGVERTLQLCGTLLRVWSVKHNFPMFHAVQAWWWLGSCCSGWVGNLPIRLQFLARGCASLRLSHHVRRTGPGNRQQVRSKYMA